MGRSSSSGGSGGAGATSGISSGAGGSIGGIGTAHPAAHHGLRLSRQGPPPQRPPTKSTFDLHARQVLLSLSQSQTGLETSRYDRLDDENARLVRRSLGRTLRALERRQERKKKSKSSGVAADALDFYRHVLGRARKVRGLPVDEEEDLQEEELLVESSSSDGDDDDDDGEDGDESGGGDDGDGTSDGEESSSSSGDGGGSESSSGSEDESIDSEEFLNAHNDLCEVCDGVGDEDEPLLCCATCTLVFHQSCHRPVLVKEPPDNWSCAYCDDAGVTLHKRDSRERKRASRGVREMKKMIEENEAAAADEDDDDEEREKDGHDGRAGKRSAPKSSRSKSPVPSVRDPVTGRFTSPEKAEASAAAAAAEAAAMDKKDDNEEEGQTELREDRSDLTAEEIERLGSRMVKEKGEAKDDEPSPAAALAASAEATGESEASASGVASTAEMTPAATPARKDSLQSHPEGGSASSGGQQRSASKHQLKGSELRLLLGTMSPDEVDLTGPRARRQKRQAPALYDPGDRGGDKDWRGKDAVNGKKSDTGRKAEGEGQVGNKKRKRELLVFGKKKGGRKEEREAKRRKKEEKRKKRDAKKKKKTVSNNIVIV